MGAPDLADLLTDKVAVDRELTRRKLSNFVRLAFPLVEPGERYQHGWHIDAICEHLEAVSRGQIKRLVVNIPPGHAKSGLACVLWPAWAWTAIPEIRWMFGSYAETLSMRDSLKTRSLVTSDWYQERWPLALAAAQDTKAEFWNTRGGFRIATSVGGSVTGKHAHVQVCDDPIKASDAHSTAARETAIVWWDQAMSTRLLPGGARVVIMQRLHEQDLTGHILQAGGYEHLCLPEAFEPSRVIKTSLGTPDRRTQEGDLLWPERFGAELHAQRKRELGLYGAAGQLQQRPSPIEGGFLKRAWWRRYTTLPDSLTFRFDSWDMSFKGGAHNDFVCGFKFAAQGANLYVLDCIHRQLDFVQTRAEVLRLRNSHAPAPFAVLVEDTANGPAIIASLKDQVPGLVPIKPEGGKESRAHAASPTIEAGNVFLPEGAPWAEELIEESAAFPNGAHDDMVDALTQAIFWYRNSGLASFAGLVQT